MKEFEGTPAPWGIYKTDDGERIYVVDELDLTICSFDTIFSLEINQANANFISNAPEMYIELEKCAKLLRGYEIHHLQNGNRQKADRNRRRAENCEKVLAKARGE
jgi:hypothetical protein